MKIAFISVDWSRSPIAATGLPAPGGAGYYRCALPCAGINEFGGGAFEAGHFPNFVLDRKTGEIVPIDWANERHPGWDVIVFQRWMHEAGPAVIRYAQAAGQTIVNDCDDWYWGLATTNAAFISSHPRPMSLTMGKNRSAVRAERKTSLGRSDRQKLGLNLQEVTENRSNYKAILAASDMITTSTPYLASRLRHLGVPVVVVRNTIDLRLWERGPVSDTDKPMVGWVGATPWRSGDLETLRGVLPDFMRRNGLKFQHSGHAFFAEQASVQLGLPPGITCVVNMDTIDQYPGILKGIEVGLVPLKDTPFNRAKSAIKGMEYSAAGIPYIAQALDAYEEYGAGLLAERSRDWQRALQRVLDPSERKVLADSQYERVKAEDVSLRWQDWTDAYRCAERLHIQRIIKGTDSGKLSQEIDKLASMESRRRSEQDARMAMTVRH